MGGCTSIFLWSATMSITTSLPVLSTADELRARFHTHANIHGDNAYRFKTGILDVDLLKAGLRDVPASLDECAVVGIKFAGRTKNNLTQKWEEVFTAYDANGKFLARYFSGVFKALMI